MEKIAVSSAVLTTVAIFQVKSQSADAFKISQWLIANASKKTKEEEMIAQRSFVWTIAPNMENVTKKVYASVMIDGLEKIVVSMCSWYILVRIGFGLRTLWVLW
jgi:hypothetical protein